MATILRPAFQNPISCMKIVIFSFKLHWNLFSKGIDTDRSKLVQIMAWCRASDRRLSESMTTIFNLNLNASVWITITVKYIT